MSTSALESGITSVVCVKVADIRPKYANLKVWMEDPMNVYIGRRGIVFIEDEGTGERGRWPPLDSIWHNPFKIDGTHSRDDVLKLYEEYMTQKLIGDENLVRHLLRLRGKRLGCWCAPDPCHGDVLVRLIDVFSDALEIY